MDSSPDAYPGPSLGFRGAGPVAVGCYGGPSTSSGCLAVARPRWRGVVLGVESFEVDDVAVVVGDGTQDDREVVASDQCRVGSAAGAHPIDLTFQRGSRASVDLGRQRLGTPPPQPFWLAAH